MLALKNATRLNSASELLILWSEADHSGVGGRGRYSGSQHPTLASTRELAFFSVSFILLAEERKGETRRGTGPS